MELSKYPNVLYASKLFIILCLFVQCSSVFASSNNPEQSVNAPALEKYANSIFNDLLSTWDVGKTRPKLLIKTNIFYPSARSLVNGNVELSSETIKFCLSRGGDKGRHLLAFILAHELAHQSNDDMWQYRFLNASQKDSIKKRDFFTPSLRNKQLKIQNDELNADRVAITKMTVAGFNPLVIINDKTFFSDWDNSISQIQCKSQNGSTAGNGQCNEFESRYFHISEMLEYVARQSTLFRMGVQYLVVGDYVKARNYLETFSVDYPSSKVYESIGLSYLLQAYEIIKNKLPSDVRGQLLLPIYLTDRLEYDFHETIKNFSKEKSTRSNDTDNSVLNSKIEQVLLKAVHYFELSEKINKNNVVLFNRIVTYMLLKKPTLAYGLLIDDYHNEYGSDLYFMYSKALLAAYEYKSTDAITYFQRIKNEHLNNTKQIQSLVMLNIAILEGKSELYDKIYRTSMYEDISIDEQSTTGLHKHQLDLSRVGGLSVQNLISRKIIKNSMKFPLWYRDQRYFIYMSSDDNVYVVDSTSHIIAAWSSADKKQLLPDGLTEYGDPERVMWTENKKYHIYDTHQFVLSITDQNINWFIF